jgi:LCP family protein required for cell wall assembly
VTTSETRSETVLLRRTWPQRIVILACLGVIGSAIAASFFLTDFYEGVADIGRVQFSGDLLQTDTAPTSPVNFLIVGLDSAVGLDPDDPAAVGRQYDERGTHNADSISILRVDPVGGKAWAISVPRDLVVPIPCARTPDLRINAASLVGGGPCLVEAVSDALFIQINHYVQLDFLAFRDVVDELDGVPIWFPFAARDPGTGFFVVEPGCYKLDGAQALNFVRARRYQEFRDGEWVDVGNADLGRIQRQQSFVVAAIERAIARGARNPTSLSALINSAADSVVLDQGLTPAELVQLAEAFTGFTSDSLTTFSPAVADIVRDGSWIGLELIEPLDSEMFQVLRGIADTIPRADVTFTVVGTDESTVVDDAELLRQLGFSVARERLVTSIGNHSVIVHPAGQRRHAELLARYIVPTPAVAENPRAAEMMLILGSDHREVSFFYPVGEAETLAAIATLGDVAIPELDNVTSEPVSTTTGVPSPTMAPDSNLTTTVPPAATVLPGLAPEGESCS